MSWQNSKEHAELVAKYDDYLQTERSKAASAEQRFHLAEQKIRANHAIEINALKAAHKIELHQKDQDLLHFKDDELEKARTKQIKAEKELAVFEKENEMLTKITDLNGDVIDIKDLVKSLIQKLPDINISSLTMQSLPAGKDK